MAPERSVASLGLRAEHVDVDYRSADRVVAGLRDVSVAFQPGQLTVLSGPSGSGKSSLLRVLGLLDVPTRGRIVLDGLDSTRLGARQRRLLRASRIAYVHQQPVSNLLEDLRAGQHIAFGRHVARCAAVDTHRALAEYRLDHVHDSQVTDLSGGEQQRLAFALAAAREPAVILADEPTAQLDRHNARDLIAVLRNLVGNDVTAVIASHDPEVLAAADVVVHLRDGEVSDAPH